MENVTTYSDVFKLLDLPKETLWAAYEKWVEKNNEGKEVPSIYSYFRWFGEVLRTLGSMEAVVGGSYSDYIAFFFAGLFAGLDPKKDPMPLYDEGFLGTIHVTSEDRQILERLGF